MAFRLPPFLFVAAKVQLFFELCKFLGKHPCFCLFPNTNPSIYNIARAGWTNRSRWSTALFCAIQGLTSNRLGCPYPESATKVIHKSAKLRQTKKSMRIVAFFFQF